MIGNYVYVVINKPIYYRETEPIVLPTIYSNGVMRKVQASEVYYFDFPDSSYVFTTIVAINVQDAGEEPTTKTFLMGYSRNMYMSTGNMYIVYTKRMSEFEFYDRIIDKAIMPVVPLSIKSKINEIRTSEAGKAEKLQRIGEALQDYIESLNPEDAASVTKNVEERMREVYKEMAKETEKTIIHKISVSNGKIEYKMKGEVPGYVLNQFSMDEYKEHFRIATTTGRWRDASTNNVYVLDEGLRIVGKVEDLAPGERIYSARFIGDKGFMVTFRQVDPLFVIDLTEPTSPRVLGYLKIPGVSDYLHPYDESHIIGVGRDATEEGVMKGLKLSLFDISDVSNPKEISKYIIGERGTDSYALRDHKAFLFSRSKKLLVIPVRLAEGGRWNAWQGAYAFSLDLDNGFVLKGRVTHSNKTEWYYSSQIKRSLYIDNILYTISGRKIMMHDLDNLEAVNSIELPEEQLYSVIHKNI